MQKKLKLPVGSINKRRLEINACYGEGTNVEPIRFVSLCTFIIVYGMVRYSLFFLGAELGGKENKSRPRN
jgi:hypothetical protein